MMDRMAQIGRGRSGVPLSWNTQGQLVSVSTNGAFAESYAYDPLGRRVSTTSLSTTNHQPSTVYHLYDGDRCVADVSPAGTLLRSYAWGNGIDDLLAMTVCSGSSTNSYYAVKDHLGSVQALVDASGTVVESYSYDAWGNVLTGAQQSAIGNRYLWQGREYSFATGLYNFRARWYDPQSGRWLSKDPVGLEGGLNLYAFCGDDPVNFKDPFGLKVRMGGTMQQKQQLLAYLQSFVRGSLSVSPDGFVSRKSCDQDEKYEGQIDSLINSGNTYNIDIGDADLYGGGKFDPDDFNTGGTITLSPNISGTYLGYGEGWLSLPKVYERVPASVLAHEVGHAISHVQKVENSDQRLPAGDSRKGSLEREAWQRTTVPYRRLGKGIPTR